MLPTMENNLKTAGQTANSNKKQTNKAWGIVSLAGALVAVTCFGSLWITGCATAVFVIGAYLGGYMDETLAAIKAARRSEESSESLAA